jgi:hypothetical protein
MRRLLLGAALPLVVAAKSATAQDEAALRGAFEGRMVALRIDMPATSRGVDVHPLEPAPVDFRKVAERLKASGTAVRMGQSIMVTKVAVRGSHVEFQLGGGGYGTFGDWGDSHVRAVSARESPQERSLREAIKRSPDRGERRRLERELNALRSVRERENGRAAAEAEQANLAREASVRAKRAEAGSRFNIRYHEAIPPDGLTPAGVMRALARYVDFAAGPGAAPGAGVALLAPAHDAGGAAALRHGQTVEQVEALLGPAAGVAEAREGSLTVTRRSYRREGTHVVASFVSGVLIHFSVTPR